MPRNRSLRLAWAALGCGLVLAAGCRRGDEGKLANRPADGGRYRIVTTCGMVTDLVRNVAGSRAEVVGLMGEGVDPHLYKPTRGDVKQLLDADVVFYSGLLLEGRMADVLTQTARGGKPVFAVTEAIDREVLREPPEFAGHYDPHVWMDPRLWSQCLTTVVEALGEFDPAGADEYRANAQRYRDALTALDAYVRRVIGSIPPAERHLITAHDAFGYFGAAYDIPVRSIQGISTDSEAGIEDVNRLIDFIVENKVRAIFVESSVSERNVNAVIEGAARRGWMLAKGGQLFSDAMGRPGSYEGTYIGMLDHNATTIARALGGEAPPRGMAGLLADDATREMAAVNPPP